MKPSELNRRDFSKFTVAAFGGILAGSAMGCGGEDKPEATPAAGGSETTGAETAGTDTTVAAAEKHICRGLNTCKGKGADGKNDCAGQGTCATSNKHSCHAANECKGLGGCDGTAGQNDCKGKGGCGVPLNEGTWAKVRAAFEEKRKAAGEPVGAAPAAG